MIKLIYNVSLKWKIIVSLSSIGFRSLLLTDHADARYFIFDGSLLFKLVFAIPHADHQHKTLGSRLTRGNGVDKHFSLWPLVMLPSNDCKQSPHKSMLVK